MDTIKVRLQLPPSKPGEQGLYTSAWDCFKKTVQKEGVKGLYKGMTAPLCTVTSIYAMSFFGYGLGRKIFSYSGDKKDLSKLEIFIAGAFAGLVTSTITTPGERVKCLLQVQRASAEIAKYHGMVDTIRQLYIEGGVRSIYKGSVITIIRDAPSSGIFYLTYDSIKNGLLPEKASKNLKFQITIFAGGCAGIANWVVAMPADVIKTRLQTAPVGKYRNGMKDVFRDLRANEGLTALYHGITPVMIRAFPANAACFLGFELVALFLNWVVPNL